MPRQLRDYERLLFRYLLGYATFHLLALTFFISTKDDWDGFIYLILFFVQAPLMLLGAGLSLVARWLKRRWGWGLALLIFVLSNSQATYEFFHLNSISWFYSLVFLLGLPPIILTAHLTLLTEGRKGL